MTKDTDRKNRHKTPRFRDFEDGDVGWEEKQEIQNRHRKPGKKNNRKQGSRDKW